MRSIIIALATYSRIPMLRVEGNDKDLRYAICAFPLVGVIIAAAEYLLLTVSRYFSMPEAAVACLVIALPVLVTGGIHLDGFVDTSDARSSYKSREEKLKILKDPHVGAFGIIRLILYFLLVFAGLLTLLDRELPFRELAALLILPVLSRALSGLCVETIPKAKSDGMLAGMFGTERQKGPAVLLVAEILFCMAGIVYLSPFTGAAIFFSEGLLFLYFRRMALKEFGGVTGDLAGWYLCVAEGIGIWAVVLLQIICTITGIAFL